jgi:photosystem I subunit 11
MEPVDARAPLPRRSTPRGPSIAPRRGSNFATVKRASRMIAASATRPRRCSERSLTHVHETHLLIAKPNSATQKASFAVRAASDEQAQVIKPINGDPFIGMLETPVTSAPIVANFLSNLPAYRTGVSPLTRGVEVGLAHGFFLTGPFIKLGPLRATESAEIAGCLSGAGLVLILTACLSIYGATAFQTEEVIGVKTLSGRDVNRDPVQSSDGWAKFTSGWLVGGLSGVAWSYFLTQVLPYYS